MGGLFRAPKPAAPVQDDAAVEQIWQQTGGRPFPIQAICHRLVSMRNRQGRREPIDGDEVLAVLAEMAGGGNGMVGNGLGRAQASGALSLGSAP